MRRLFCDGCEQPIKPGADVISIGISINIAPPELDESDQQLLIPHLGCLVHSPPRMRVACTPECLASIVAPALEHARKANDALKSDIEVQSGAPYGTIPRIRPMVPRKV